MTDGSTGGWSSVAQDDGDERISHHSSGNAHNLYVRSRLIHARDLPNDTWAVYESLTGVGSICPVRHLSGHLPLLKLPTCTFRGASGRVPPPRTIPLDVL